MLLALSLCRGRREGAVMLWVCQEKLDKACQAMAELADSQMTAGDRQKIIPPQQKFDKRKWETLVLGLLSMTGEPCSAVLPEGTKFVSGFGSGNTKVFP